MKRLTDWLVYIVARCFLCFIQMMPLEACHAVSRYLAILANDVVRLRGKVVAENLANTFPQASIAERKQMARRMWEHLFLMLCEIAHAPRKLHETNWRRFIRFQNKPDLMRYLLDPRPTVLVSGHFGNFELASYMSGLFGFHTHAVARKLDNPFLHDFVNRFRESKGQFILPKDGSANQVADLLAAGGTLSILADQAAGPKGCWVDFLGRPASCHKALALFTLVSGAPMVVMTCTRRGGPFEFDMTCEGVTDPAILSPQMADVTALTQWYNDRLGSAIRRVPSQYWWVHRRWKDTPPKKKAKPAADALKAA